MYCSAHNDTTLALDAFGRKQGELSTLTDVGPLIETMDKFTARIQALEARVLVSERATEAAIGRLSGAIDTRIGALEARESQRVYMRTDVAAQGKRVHHTRRYSQ